MMDARQFESIKEKISTLKDKRSRAEGAIDGILAEWKASYGVDSEEEIEAILGKEKKELAENESLIEQAYEELKRLTNWGLV